MKRLLAVLLILISIQGFSQTKLKRNIILVDTLTVTNNAYIPFATEPTQAAQLQQVNSIVELNFDSIRDGYVPIRDSVEGILKSSPIYVDDDGNVVVTTNLLSTGEIQAWTNTGTLPPTFWDALPIASTTSTGIAQFIGTDFAVDTNGLVSIIGGAGTSIWGGITGALSDQTDLQDALDLKYDAADFSNDWDYNLLLKSTTDLSEGTHLYYTDDRVSANSNVVANTSKVTMTYLPQE